MLVVGLFALYLSLDCPSGTAPVGDECYPEACVFDGTVCSNHGDCFKTGCECDKGFVLAENGCQRKGCVDSKTKYYCGRHGKCSDSAPFTCKCEEGYTLVGHTCAPPNCMTGSSICNGHGNCVYENDQPRCKCSKSYSGAKCDTCAKDNTLIGTKCVYDSCVSEVTGERTSCGGHGLCIPPIGSLSAFCLCLPGTKKVDGGCVPSACVSSGSKTGRICNGHGSCEHRECKCADGYEGDQCQYRTKECPDGFVSKKGECVSVECVSSDGDVCFGHGVCADKRCICDEGSVLIGTTDCVPLTCIVSGGVCPHGVCESIDGKWGCTCDMWYTMIHGRCTPNACITGYNSVGFPVVCSDRGVCDDATEKCSCYHTYQGDLCQDCSSIALRMDNGECMPIVCISDMIDGVPQVCSGHGTCKTDLATTTDYVDYCDCELDYQALDGGICVPESCMNPTTQWTICTKHGRCIDKKCVCNKGFFGQYCEDYKCPEGELYTLMGCYPEACVVSYDDGQRRVCGGQGKCVESRGKFLCKCNPNTVVIDGACVANSCITNPDLDIVCSGNGLCRDGFCLCNKGFRGGFCERAD